MKTTKISVRVGATLIVILTLTGCGSKTESDGAHFGPPMGGDRPASNTAPAAVPIQVETVAQRSISEFLRSNGTLEAENEVDLVARTSGPITELLVEEGDTVQAGRLLARIDDLEARNQVAIATVSRDEARLAFDRARTTLDKGLVSQEAYDSALSALQSSEAQLGSATIQLAYTEIRAPFTALVATRYIRLAQFVTPGDSLFRISDFTPLLCPIEVPEKDLSKLHLDQDARLTVEAFPGEDFTAQVQRIRPTVDAGTGTVTVTLEVDGRGLLRPGMFASVYLHTTTHHGALVIPRNALVLDSIGDTVYIREGDVAVRRDVRLGIREQDLVEVLDGLAAGDEVVVLGQEGLSNGTPVTVLGGEPPPAAAAQPDPDRIDAMRQRMRERGLSDEEIAQRIQRMGDGGGGPPQGGPPRDKPGGGEIPDRMKERIRNASPEELEQIKERMRSFGMPDDTIEETVNRIRGGEESQK